MIKFFNYLDEYHKIKNEIHKSIEKVFNSGQLILGNQVKIFENNFAKFLNCKYGIGVNSGTDAITIALKAFNFPPNSEVITVANTTVPTIAAIRNANLKPVFADINLENLQIEPNNIKRLITSKTKAVVVVHLYGIPAPINEIKKICKKYDLILLEDCAQSHGSKLGQKFTGSFGDVSCFSFYPTKNLGAYGDAGICITSKKKLYEKMKKLRAYGYNNKMCSIFEGINSRMDELQAGILNVKLKYFKKNILLRKKIAERYLSEINNNKIIFPVPTKNSYAAYHLFVIRCFKRNQLQKYLYENGIETKIHYPVPVHLMQAYKFLKYCKNSLPNTEKASMQILSIPIYPGLKDEEISKIIQTLNKF